MAQLEDFGYLDHLRVTVAFGGAPDKPADEVFMLEIYPRIPAGETWDEKPYLERLKPILHATGKAYPEFHALTVTKRETNWGATGAAADILLFVALAQASDMRSSAEAVRAAFQDILARFGDASQTPPLRHDVTARAKWRVAASYAGLTVDHLAVTAEEHQAGAGSWVVGLDAPDGAGFVVELGFVDANLATAHITRISPREVTDSLGVSGA